MKKYHVYSVGTALIDYQYHLTQELSTKFSLEHGGTIINAEEEQELLQKLSTVNPVMVCGGTGANTLAMISHLGGKTFYACKIADDQAGHLYQENLQKEGITTHLKFDRQLATGKCFILVRPDGERILHTFLGANCNLSPLDLHEEIIRNSHYIFIEAFSSAVSHSSKLTAETAIKIAKSFDTKVALTLSTCRPSFFSHQDFVKTVGVGVDLLFCNESEAEFFCRTDNINKMIDPLKKVAKQFVITQGSKGVLLFDGIQLQEIAGKKSIAIDTTGAGDIFAGAFLFALNSGMPFLQAGSFANDCAAESVSHTGARLTSAIITGLKNRFLHQKSNA